MPTIAQALQGAQAQGLPRLEAQLLLAALLLRSRSWLLAHDDEPLPQAHEAQWRHWVQQRLDQVPLAYLSGQHEFYGLSLQISPAVLDPRPDTETLVDWALACLQTQPPGAHVLDLGTGSGAIALALAHARPDAHVCAIDRSPEALQVAQTNGQALNLRVRWLQGSWFEPVRGERFGLIVSNPPYLADDDPHLPALRHEPRQALCAGADGLDDLRTLCAQAAEHLQPGGWILFEHGSTQADQVADLLGDNGFVQISHRLDLAGHTRCTGARHGP
jgi:release factor glutamine methyltransferase